LVEADFGVRCQRIEQEYVRDPIARRIDPDWHERRLGDGLARIRRRLDGQRLAKVRKLLAIGFRNGSHTPWIERLLAWYYDPM
jgi:tRNA 2-selenouridine synthase SelU